MYVVYECSVTLQTLHLCSKACLRSVNIFHSTLDLNIGNNINFTYPLLKYLEVLYSILEFMNSSGCPFFDRNEGVVFVQSIQPSVKLNN